MERKQILIEIVAEFVDKGLKAGSQAIKDLTRSTQGGGLGGLLGGAAGTKQLSQTETILRGLQGVFRGLSADGSRARLSIADVTRILDQMAARGRISGTVMDALGKTIARSGQDGTIGADKLLRSLAGLARTGQITTATFSQIGLSMSRLLPTFAATSREAANLAKVSQVFRGLRNTFQNVTADGIRFRLSIADISRIMDGFAAKGQLSTQAMNTLTRVLAQARAASSDGKIGVDEFLNTLNQLAQNGEVSASVFSRFGGQLVKLVPQAEAAGRGILASLGQVGPIISRLITQLAQGTNAFAALRVAASGLLGIVAKLLPILLPLVAAFAAFRLALSGIGAVLNVVRSGFSALFRLITGLLSPIFDLGRALFDLGRQFAVDKIREGFELIKSSALDANAAVETSRQVFGTLSGGGVAVGARQLEIVRQIALETGFAFEDLVRAARRIPQVTGQNLQLFADILRRSVGLALLDPQQGIIGATFAAVEAIGEGTARGFTSLSTRFEVSKVIIREALAETGNSVEAFNQVLDRMGVTQEFVAAQTDTFTVAMLQIRGVFQEFFRLAGQPVFERFSASVRALRDRLFELRPVLFGIAQAIGEFLGRIADALGLFQTGFLDRLDPLAFFNRAVEIMNALARGFFTGLNFVLRVLNQAARAIARFFGLEIVQKPTEQAGRGAINIGGIAKAFDQVKAAAAAATAAAQKAGQAVKEAAAEAAKVAQAEGAADLIAKLEERQRQLALGIADLDEQEKNQKAQLKILEKGLKQAERAVDESRNRLRRFDIETADIPERFTRARRRQLELEILGRDEVVDKRKEELELIKEAANATKDARAEQEKLLDAVEAQLKKLRELQEELAEEGAGAIDTSFQDVELDAQLEAQTQAFKDLASQALEPLFNTISTGIEQAKTSFGELTGFIGSIDFGAAIQKVRDFWGEFVIGIEKARPFWDFLVQASENFALVLGIVILRQIGRWFAFINIVRLVGFVLADFVNRGVEKLQILAGWFEKLIELVGRFLDRAAGLIGLNTNFGAGLGGFNLRNALGGGFNLGNLPSILTRDLVQPLDLSGLGISLNLDAEETRRLMEEGTYTGISNVFGPAN